jgi:hypothetical protein
MRILREGVTYENVTLKPVGNTVVAGHVIAQHGVLETHPLCEDITEYDAEGNEVIYYPIAFEEEAPA